MAKQDARFDFLFARGFHIASVFHAVLCCRDNPVAAQDLRVVPDTLHRRGGGKRKFVAFKLCVYSRCPECVNFPLRVCALRAFLANHAIDRRFLRGDARDNVVKLLAVALCGSALEGIGDDSHGIPFRGFRPLVSLEVNLECVSQ